MYLFLIAQIRNLKLGRNFNGDNCQVHSARNLIFSRLIGAPKVKGMKTYC